MKLYNRKTSYYTIITIPKSLVSKYGKKQIWRSLNTKDSKLANLLWNICIMFNIALCKRQGWNVRSVYRYYLGFRQQDNIFLQWS